MNIFDEGAIEDVIEGSREKSIAVDWLFQETKSKRRSEVKSLGKTEECIVGFWDWCKIMNRIADSHDPSEISLRVIELLEHNDPFQAMDIFDRVASEHNPSKVWN